MTGDPTLLLQPVEPTAQARRRESQVGGDVERTGPPAETLQRRQDVEPSELDVPVGAQLLVESALDLTDDGLQPPPCPNA